MLSYFNWHSYCRPNGPGQLSLLPSAGREMSIRFKSAVSDALRLGSKGCGRTLKGPI